MFSRADQLRVAEIEKDFRLHALSYHWDNFVPSLLIYNTEDGQLSNLNFEDCLGLSVSKRRLCIGSFVDDQYIPCPEKMRVKRFAQCKDCSEELISIQECLFEPKCDGDLCDSPICRREHAIYIAFFGTTPKVGMTLKKRVGRRLVEQGADAYFIIGTQESRKRARDMEKMIAHKLRITERPTSSNVLRSLNIAKKRGHIEELYHGLSKSLTDLDFDPGELQFLEEYPLPEPLDQVPKLTESWGMHSGGLLGIKGKYLIYSSNRLMAIDLSDLPSRFLSIDDD